MMTDTYTTPTGPNGVLYDGQLPSFDPGQYATPRPSRKVRQPDGLFHCDVDDCVFTANTPQAISSHHFRMHGDPEKVALYRQRLSAAHQASNARKKAAKAAPPSKTKDVALTCEDQELAALIAAMDPADRKRLRDSRAKWVKQHGTADRWEELKLAHLRGGPSLHSSRTKTITTGVIVKPSPAELAEREQRRQADDLFDRVAAATDALFPDRVPAVRILEVAAWQQETMRLLLQP